MRLQYVISLFQPLNPTWTRGGGLILAPPPVMIICCTLRDAPMNSKLLEVFNYNPNLPLKNIFLPYRSTTLRKLTANYKNQETFSIKKPNNLFLFNFFRKMPSNIIYQSKVSSIEIGRSFGKLTSGSPVLPKKCLLCRLICKTGKTAQKV
jgi:hypothetical protein